MKCVCLVLSAAVAHSFPHCLLSFVPPSSLLLAVETLACFCDGVQMCACVSHPPAYLPCTQFEDGLVSLEFRKGFRMGDKLVRPAMVKVSRFHCFERSKV